ncbi:terminase [Sinorhizobium medicae]|nr:terminase [Sinorhizobium medicae]MDX0818043.1 terminase [Sinorhizobium medicae]
MLSRSLAHALDPASFMAGAGFSPDPWQATFLRSTSRRSLLLCSRQTGKSTVTAALASHTAIYEPGALVLLLAPSQQQSRELFRKVCEFVRGIATVDLDAESASRIEFPNGSRIVSLSGNPMTVRGFSGPRLVVIDEACFLPDDELFHAVSPMLAAGGRLLCLSTPNGKRGFFWEAWAGDDPIWTRTRITANDTPRISPEFLAAERASKPEHRIRAEYMCEFVDTDLQFVSSDLIARAMSPAIAPLFSQPLVW